MDIQENWCLNWNLPQRTRGGTFRCRVPVPRRIACSCRLPLTTVWPWSSADTRGRVWCGARRRTRSCRHPKPWSSVRLKEAILRRSACLHSTGQIPETKCFSTYHKQLSTCEMARCSWREIFGIPLNWWSARKREIDRGWYRQGLTN